MRGPDEEHSRKAEHSATKKKEEGDSNQMEMIKRFVREEEGANLVEYALLVTFIAIVVVGGASLLGASLDAWFTALSGAVDNMAAAVAAA